MSQIQSKNTLRAWALPFLALNAPAYAAQVSLAWDASSSTNVGGYKLAYGEQPGSYSATVDVGKVLTYTLGNLTDGKTYYFAVKAYDTTKTVESVYSNEVSKSLPGTSGLAASFTASPASGDAPLSVSFKPTVTGTVQSWKWDFGDGTSNSGATATVPTAMKSYSKAGAYTVTLTLTGPSGTITRTSQVTVAPVAAFAASTEAGPAPLAVNFTDSSTGSPTSWAWNFGDNTTSTAQNPTHSYATAGTYTVTLKVNGGGVGSSNTASRSIAVGAGTGTGGGTSSGGTVSGLVAAYGFEELNGTVVADASGQKNHGSVAGAVSAAGRFGRARRFDGSNDQIAVPDSNSLDLSNALTLEAWVNPATSTGGGRTIFAKETAGGAVYNLYSSEDTNLPLASVNIGGYRVITGANQLPLNQWSHLATTYDGQTQRLFVNGNQVASRAQTGPIQTSGGALKIGGNAIWGEWFSGRLDELRVYNRALSATEIQADMGKSVASATPPKTLLGQSTLGATVYPLPAGTAKAFPVTAASSGLITRLSVYVDATSQTGPLALGLYSDNQGRPGNRLATATRATTSPGGWNHVSLPATAVNAGTKYWIAILNPSGTANTAVNLRSGNNGATVASSAQTTLTTLPSSWTIGVMPNDGSLSGYGAGY